MRRIRARRILKDCADVWPIRESAAQPPSNWPGWPEQRQFALVLTHDVETKRGLDQVQPLAEIEMRHGFRSSFNFIPEGPYAVPDRLRAWLVEHGFEVGVHDLHHDGKLYASRARFYRHAARINHYLQEWNACGFRAGFMLHQAGWLHDLNILYDMSTFDTDPFEPQPEGVNTIFPYWVPSQYGCGYAQLPYTLPQDSTLFLLLRHLDIAVWKQKCAWIVQHGGMMLLNVHPDYLNFPGTHSVPSAFDADHYARFLAYLKSAFEQSYWHVLPRDIANFVSRFNIERPVMTRLESDLLSSSQTQFRL